MGITALGSTTRTRMDLSILLFTAFLVSGNFALEYPPRNEGDSWSCAITPKDGCSGKVRVKNENFTLSVDPLGTIGCPPPGEKFITVLSDSPDCEGFDFIFGNISGVVSATAWPSNGTLPCPLIGYDIVIRPGDEYCGPYEVTAGECLCDNDCFQVNTWEECASQCVGVTGSPYRGEYDGWSFQTRGTNDDQYVGNCCCKNIKQGIFQGNWPAVIFGDSKCLGAGSDSQ